MILIVEGVVMCFVLLLVCVIGIANGPVGLVVFYEQEVKNRVWCYYWYGLSAQGAGDCVGIIYYRIPAGIYRPSRDSDNKRRPWPVSKIRVRSAEQPCYGQGAELLKEIFQFVGMFLRMCFRGYVPDRISANRRERWQSISFPRATWRSVVCLRG